MGMLVQIFATIIVCFPCLDLGLIANMPSSTVEHFLSTNTSLERPMTDSDVNLYGSLASAGSMVGTPIFAPLLDRIGRKYTSMLLALTTVIGWAILAITDKVEVLLAGVFISGVSGVGILTVPVFCGEFVQESIRGLATAGSMFAYGVGMLMSYLLGDYLDYKMMVYTTLGFTIVQLVMMTWLKESPTLLLMKGREEEAAQAIAFYRQVKVTSKLVSNELTCIKRCLTHEDYSELVPVKDVTNATEDDTEIFVGDERQKQYTPKKKSFWQHLKSSPAARRGFIIVLVTMLVTIFQGMVAIQVFAGPVFQEAAPGISPARCAMILAITTVVSNLAGAYASDVAGRRPILISSSASGCFFCLIIGSQIQWSWAPSWLSALCLYMSSVVYNIGGATVPYTLLAEMFPPEVKSFLGMVVVIWLSLCYFVCLLVFYPLVSILGLYGVFYFYGGVCFTCVLYTAFFVPETKGLKMDVVQVMLAERRIFPPDHEVPSS